MYAVCIFLGCVCVGLIVLTDGVISVPDGGYLDMILSQVSGLNFKCKVSNPVSSRKFRSFFFNSVRATIPTVCFCFSSATTQFRVHLFNSLVHFILMHLTGFYPTWT